MFRIHNWSLQAKNDTYWYEIKAYYDSKTPLSHILKVWWTSIAAMKWKTPLTVLKGRWMMQTRPVNSYNWTSIASELNSVPRISQNQLLLGNSFHPHVEVLATLKWSLLGVYSPVSVVTWALWLSVAVTPSHWLNVKYFSIKWTALWWWWCFCVDDSMELMLMLSVGVIASSESDLCLLLCFRIPAHL